MFGLHNNSDQRQIFLCKINAFSVGGVVRIEDMITQHSVDRLRNSQRLCYK